ncbi:helix-turn-helix transcriptional regulator [Micrococcaceae bacterium RIT802]|nr:helix-turn-helix transcriptional regulator [Micrococcaceae bacterium RIT 802]
MHPFRHALQRDDEVWHVAEDVEWLETVTRTAVAGNGVVLYGDPGAGQDEFAWDIAHRLAARAGLLELECPPDAATSASLAALVAGPPSPGRVLYIPDITTFTGPDLELVARLVLRDRAVVIAAVSDPQGAPDAPLTQHVRLERIRVRDMNLDQGMDYLHNGLDGPLSDRAGYAIWENGGGNRAMMRLIAEDWREAGFLVREDDIWVVRGATPPVGPRLARYWDDWLAHQDAEVRDAFEMLALARELPLNVLLALCGAEVVDAVHDWGYLNVRDSMRRDVSLRGMINVQTIAAQVPPGRSRRLLDRVTDFVDQQGVHRPPGLVPWRLHCGLPVAPERFIEGAEHLLTTTSPLEALEMLKQVPDDVEPARVDAVRIGALLAAGEFVDLWTRVGNLRLSTPGGRELPSSSDGDHRTTPAAGLIAASWRGDYRPILEAEESQPRLAEGASWLWQQIRHEAMVLSGRVQEGLHADRDLMHVLEQSGAAPFLVQRARMGVFDVECLAGEWTRAVETLAGGWNAESGAPGPGKAGASYNAIAHVLCGEYDAAAGILRREIPQLRVLGRHDVLPLAYAVHGAALAGAGHRSEALTALAAIELPRIAGHGLWRFDWSATFFTAQALGLLGRVDAAVELLLDFAAKDRALGNYSQELLTLSAAVQWGEDSAVDLLATAAERADGRFAEACTWVVRGLRNRDPAELEYGTLLCRSIGQHFFGEFAQRRLEALNGPCPTAAAAADKTGATDPPYAPTRDANQAIQVLTPRQRDIVRHVLADRTNGEIAESFGLSVRTVESHLYQAYAKLNVSNRSELRASLDPGDPLWNGPSQLT